MGLIAGLRVVGGGGVCLWGEGEESVMIRSLGRLG